MLDQNDRSWLCKSAISQSARADVFFLLKSELYKGKEKDFRENRHDTIAIPTPSVGDPPRTHLSLEEVLAREDGVAAHYQCVRARARELGKSLNEIRHHFWLRMVLISDGETVSFPWCDTWSEMDRFFQWLETADDGKDWWDADQGWEMAVIRAGDRFHVREGDGEGEEYFNIALPREPLLASVASLRDRVPKLLARLVDRIGEDNWTTHRR